MLQWRLAFSNAFKEMTQKFALHLTDQLAWLRSYIPAPEDTITVLDVEEL